MNQTLEIQELAIVITAKNYDPSFLNPGLLKYSGIIPEDWKLAKKPELNNRSSQLVFQNGVSIISRPNRLIFVEPLNRQEDRTVNIPALAHRCTEVLRTIEYLAVDINYRGYINCPNSTVETNNYLFDNLIKSGEWQSCGNSSVKAEVNLMFTYDEKRLNLKINEAALGLPDSEKLPIVLFSGRFNYNLTSEKPGDRLPKLERIIDNWHQDLELYKNVVTKVANLHSDGAKSETQVVTV